MFWQNVAFVDRLFFLSRVEASIVADRQFVKTALRINYLPSWGIQRSSK